MVTGDELARVISAAAHELGLSPDISAELAARVRARIEEIDGDGWASAQRASSEPPAGDPPLVERELGHAPPRRRRPLGLQELRW